MIDDAVPIDVPIHVFPSWENHVVDGGPCWCNPDIVQPCPECEEPPKPDCWRCSGNGQVDVYTDDFGVIVSHHAADSEFDC